MIFFCECVQVGDWGRQGQLNQSHVAADMARVADAHRPDFIISTGDNFYECKPFAELFCGSIPAVTAPQWCKKSFASSCALDRVGTLLTYLTVDRF